MLISLDLLKELQITSVRMSKFFLIALCSLIIAKKVGNVSLVVEKFKRAFSTLELMILIGSVLTLLFEFDLPTYFLSVTAMSIDIAEFGYSYRTELLSSSLLLYVFLRFGRYLYTKHTEANNFCYDDISGDTIKV